MLTKLRKVSDFAVNITVDLDGSGTKTITLFICQVYKHEDTYGVLFDSTQNSANVKPASVTGYWYNFTILCDRLRKIMEDFVRRAGRLTKI